MITPCNGLNPWATQRVAGKFVYVVKRQVAGTFLNEYRFPDGEVLQEYVQAWPPGEDFPFIALKDRDSRPLKQSLWTKYQMGY